MNTRRTRLLLASIGVSAATGLFSSCSNLQNLMDLGAALAPGAGGARVTELVVGHTTDNSAHVNVETERVGRFRLTLADADGERLGDVVGRTTAETASRTVIALNGLEPQTEYCLLSESRPVGRFRTLPPPGAEVPVRIGIGSCFDFDQERVTVHPDGVSEERWENHQIWRRLSEDALDAFALIGDRFYMPGSYEWYDDKTEDEVRASFREHHRGSMSIPGVAGRLSTVPTYVVWDDHDYGPNNAAGDFRFKHLAMEELLRTHANPPMGEPGNEGCYFKVTIGPVECFFLDDRSFRDSADLVSVDRRGNEHHVTTPEEVSDEWGVYHAVHPLREMHGERQMAWLREGLLESDAKVKLIISGNQMLSNIHPWEAWYMYAERDAFLVWLREAQIPGVVFVAGDRHQGGIGVLREGGPYPLYELTSSGLGVNVYETDHDTPESLYDILGAANVPHWGVVEYDPAGGGTVTLRLEGIDETIQAVRIPLRLLNAAR
jgi:phosphodiesterase/alkaline phosphatase D-like protein